MNTRYLICFLLGLAGCEPDLVPVYLSVSHAGTTCSDYTTLYLPAEYWWEYSRDAEVTCSDMTWSVLTDDGDCWDLHGECGGNARGDPYVTRNAGDPPIVNPGVCESQSCNP